MSVAIVTGAGGLIGSEAVRRFVRDGYDVVGIDNDMRAEFFGEQASTRSVIDELTGELGFSFRPLVNDIRDEVAVDRIFNTYKPDLVVHTAAQPSHDWAAGDPFTDFTVNANGTLSLLQATRRHAPEATFVHCSTSKVYGDTPNRLPLRVVGDRFDLDYGHPYWEGIDTTMSIDQSTHSLFGVSKIAGDLLVQEYGRYFGIPTVCFRPGCLTGPNHQGAMLHGFLSYLMRCCMTGSHYTVIGYAGKQVRCNVHAADLVDAFARFHADPQIAAVYNIGGGRDSNCSMLEAIELAEEIVGQDLEWSYKDEPRVGDHKWWISDNGPFQADYPDWKVHHDTRSILQDIYDQRADEWT